MILKLKFNFIFKMEFREIGRTFRVVERFKSYRRAAIAGVAIADAAQCLAQENYFVTYTHHMEEPGNLEFATKSVTGFPRAAMPSGEMPLRWNTA